MVMVAPVIPGLNDVEIPQILQRAAEAGAQAANYVLLRLPGPVRTIFLEWLQRNLPSHYDRVVSRIRQTRGGALNDPRFGSRMRGQGVLAEQIEQTFRVFAHRCGLDRRLPPLEVAHFRPPRDDQGQGHMF